MKSCGQEIPFFLDLVLKETSLKSLDREDLSYLKKQTQIGWFAILSSFTGETGKGWGQ
jgi:hypothetical protein